MRNQSLLTSTDAQKIMEACKEEARKNNWAVSIAIMDANASLLMFERLEGASATTADIAMGKAKASAMMRRSSGSLGGLLKEHPGLAGLDGKGLWLQGAVPVMFQDECVGSVGVSGVKAEEDEQVAKIGASVAWMEW